jgi:hypothetical protein
MRVARSWGAAQIPGPTIEKKMARFCAADSHYVPLAQIAAEMGRVVIYNAVGLAEVSAAAGLWQTLSCRCEGAAIA